MIKPLLSLALLSVLTSIPNVTVAGRAEEQYKKKYVMPAVKSAQRAFKKACGCKLSIAVASNLQEDGELRAIRSTVQSIKSDVGSYCSNEVAKKIACKMTTLNIEKAKNKVTFEFRGSEGTAYAHASGYMRWENMALVISDQTGSKNNKIMN